MQKDKKGHLEITKAYENLEFLSGPPARLIRILAEMIEPDARFRKQCVRDTVVFFGSARILPRRDALARLKKMDVKVMGTRNPSAELRREHAQARRDLAMSEYYERAAQLSEKLTRYFMTLKKRGRNFLVCSGGGPGIMEAANYGAKKAGGKSIGLNISLPMEQYPNPYQSKDLAFEFHYFFIRKFWFFYLAKALVVFPGGFGTLDEFFELLTLMQTGKAKKHMGVVLFGSEYWHSIINFNKMVEWGMISPEDLKLFKIVDDVDEAFNYLKGELERYSHPPRYCPPPSAINP
ncbi:MAG: TIGR00730 family Rossman fold protein [Candidatus Omnitrophota bacterium]